MITVIHSYVLNVQSTKTEKTIQIIFTKENALCVQTMRKVTKCGHLVKIASLNVLMELGMMNMNAKNVDGDVLNVMMMKSALHVD